MIPVFLCWLNQATDFSIFNLPCKTAGKPDFNQKSFMKSKLTKMQRRTSEVCNDVPVKLQVETGNRFDQIPECGLGFHSMSFISIGQEYTDQIILIFKHWIFYIKIKM